MKQRKAEEDKEEEQEDADPFSSSCSSSLSSSALLCFKAPCLTCLQRSLLSQSPHTSQTKKGRMAKSIKKIQPGAGVGP